MTRASCALSRCLRDAPFEIGRHQAFNFSVPRCASTLRNSIPDGMRSRPTFEKILRFRLGEAVELPVFNPGTAVSQAACGNRLVASLAISCCASSLMRLTSDLSDSISDGVRSRPGFDVESDFSLIFRPPAGGAF